MTDTEKKSYEKRILKEVKKLRKIYKEYLSEIDETDEAKETGQMSIVLFPDSNMFYTSTQFKNENRIDFWQNVSCKRQWRCTDEKGN